MGNFIYNIARGRTVEFFRRVDGNDPTNSGLTLVVINTTETDANLQDLDTLALVIANANTAEVTNTNYARKDLSDADIGSGDYDPDDTNNRTDSGKNIADQTWSSVASGDAWTDLIVCYNPDITSDVDANIIPITQHDFIVTPSGNDITAQISDSLGILRSA